MRSSLMERVGLCRCSGYDCDRGDVYWVFVNRTEDEVRLWRAADELLTCLEGTGRKNILIEIANEIDVLVDRTPYDLFTPDRQAEMIVKLREKHPGFLYSTSRGGAQAERGRGMPSPALVKAKDDVLIHAAGRSPAGVEASIKAVRAMPSANSMVRTIRLPSL